MHLYARHLFGWTELPAINIPGLVLTFGHHLSLPNGILQCAERITELLPSPEVAPTSRLYQLTLKGQ